MRGDARCQSVRYMNVLARDIQMIEEMLVHEGMIGGRMIGFQPDILVEIEGGDPSKIQGFFPVQTNQLPIQFQRRTARCQTEYRVGFPSDQGGHHLSRHHTRHYRVRLNYNVHHALSCSCNVVGLIAGLPAHDQTEIDEHTVHFDLEIRS